MQFIDRVEENHLQSKVGQCLAESSSGWTRLEHNH